MFGLIAVLAHVEPTVIDPKIDGVAREALVAAPSAKTAEPPPVVFMFHGHGGSARRCVSRFHVEKQWPEAVVVYPDGLPIDQLAPGLPVTRGQGWALACTEANRDVKFYDALRRRILRDYHADPKRVYAIGFSNGGMFVYTLWTLRAKEFAGFCPSGAALASPDMKLTVPLPCFATLSRNDPNVPSTYQQQGFDAIRAVDHSNIEGAPYGEHGTAFGGARPVVLWTYDGGHEFPFEAFPSLIKFFKSAKPD
ncbi:MAG: hypothetical protein P4L46_02935 [Fimbriimonas sp.]|nr:hypothetical protein [Fimbriimonas sp.]